MNDTGELFFEEDFIYVFNASRELDFWVDNTYDEHEFVR